jgi:hypothetical protein
MATSEGGTTKSNGCCDKETEFPTGLIEREKFCKVSKEGRKCTDFCCCVLFLVFLALWGVCFFIGYYYGEPLSLIYARDYKDRLCGTGDFENQTRTYYPRLKDDLLEFAMQTLGSITSLDFEALMNVLDFDVLNLTGICVESCPEVYDVVCTSDYLALSDMPTSSEIAQCYGGEVIEDPSTQQMLSYFGVDIPRNDFFRNHPTMCTNCWNVLLNTTEVFYRCFDIITTVGIENEVCTYPDMTDVNATLADGSPNPDYVSADDNQCLTKRVVDVYTADRPTYDNPLAELMGSTLNSLQSWASDVENSYVAIVALGIGGGIVMGFLWITLLRLCTTPLIWTTITVFILCLGLLSAYCWLMTGYLDTTAIASWVAGAAASVGLDQVAVSINTWVNTTDFGNVNVSSDDVSVTSDLGLDITTDTQTLWRVAAFISVVLWVTVIVLVIVLAKKIRIACAIIEEASVAILTMPCLAFFPFFTALFILANALFFIFSIALLSSTEGVTVGDITTSFSGYLGVNCSEDLLFNDSYFEDIEFDLDDTSSTYDDAINQLSNLTSSATCSVFDSVSAFEDTNVVTFLNWFQLFCFLWNNAVLQGIGIMVVAGAVAEWYWTRPSFDKSVKETDWMDHLEGARSFHGTPEGVFVNRGGIWDLMMCVEHLKLNDKHVVCYDRNDTTHRQLLAMRGYETEPVTLKIPKSNDGEAGLYVRFDMSHLDKWNTGLRQGKEENGEDPRAFYSSLGKKLKSCSNNRAKIEAGLNSCLEHGKASNPSFTDRDKQGIPAWKEESSIYFEGVQDPHGYYGPVDHNFGKILTSPQHQRLNNAYVHQMLLAGKLRKGGNGRDFKWPFCGSLYRTLRYHLGSVCVGAFLIAVVQLIRVIMAYIDRHTKAWQNKNKCFAVMFKILHLCLCLLEKCLKFITKNAYVMVAMRGKAFCESCCNAFKLLLTNLVQFAIVGIFSKVVVFFGKVFIVTLCAAGCYAWIKVDLSMIDASLETYVTNSFIPVTLTAILAYGVASAFLHVYDLAIATILLCFCEDFKFHSVGEPSKTADHDEVFMPTSLRNIVLSAEERRNLSHPMTFEEVRVYAESVHKVNDLDIDDVHPCHPQKGAKKKKEKEPEKLNKVAPAKTSNDVSKSTEGKDATTVSQYKGNSGGSGGVDNADII